MIAAFSEQDRRSSFCQRLSHVVKDHVIARLVGGQRGVELLDPRRRALLQPESRLLHHELVLEHVRRRRAPWVDRESDRAELDLEDRLVAVAPLGRGRQAGHVSRPHFLHEPART